MNKRLLQFMFCVAAIALPVVHANAQPPASAVTAIPAYQPQPIAAGVIRSWGHVFLKKVMASWEASFEKYHPDVTFSDNLVSSAAATGALFTNTADLGILGREIRPMEVAGYTRVMKQKPFPLEVMTGSYANADKSVALGIFVQKDNPLTQITFAQLDAIFGSEHRRGEKGNIRTWGQLGLTGLWASRTINVYTGELDAAPAFYFSQQVMLGSMLWNEHLQHFDDLNRPDGTVYEAQQHIVDALAQDPAGIAISGAGSRNPGVKLIPVAVNDGGPFVAATPENVEARTYPFARSVWIYTNQGPGHPLDPRVREFLRFIFSREGQELVRQEGEYLPLTPELAAAQLKKLEQ
jgi:phosphate transport system substrate-binding protein